MIRAPRKCNFSRVNVAPSSLPTKDKEKIAEASVSVASTDADPDKRPHEEANTQLASRLVQACPVQVCTDARPLWDYFPGMLAKAWTFEQVLAQLQPHCRTYTNHMYGKDFEARRISCVVGVAKYGELHALPWDAVPLVNEIRAYVESQLMPNYVASDQSKRPVHSKAFLYCLAHIYRDGKDQLGYHSDRESLSTVVASVSFAPDGVTRSFFFRKREIKSGKEVECEYKLGHGDVLMMKAGCQRAFKHAVLEMKDVVHPRVNLTFRLYDPCGINDPTGTKKQQQEAQKNQPTGQKRKNASVQQQAHLSKRARNNNM